jgi:hypothetical protein
MNIGIFGSIREFRWELGAVEVWNLLRTKAAAGATDVGPETGVNAVFSVQSETSPEARARRGAPIRNGAVASAVLVHLRVEPAHFDWR